MFNSEDHTVPRRRRTPSFSSSLLDSIYRSIDESKSDHHHHNHHKKQSKNQSLSDKDFNNVRRAIMIESWVEKQQNVALSNSASSSSESIWSSSETESKLKPNPKKPFRKSDSDNVAKQSPRPSVNGFSTKTKLKAMKLYGELKKVKQPISPGGRIASFLNSIFSSGNVKKAKMCYVGAVEDVTSSSENVSKPCLISRAQAKSHSGDKRSVRFYPVSVVLGEDHSKPRAHQRVYDHHHHHQYHDRDRDRDRDRSNDPCLMPLSSAIRRSFEKKSGVIRRFCGDDHDRDHHDEADDEDEDDDDDDLSYSSSDLFELDHLVGVGRYREELPVYETTSLKTNQAIANGLIL